MNLITLPGVFQPHSDTWMLAEVLHGETTASGGTVLDLGTGSGALAVTAALLGARVTAVDVSRRALWSARLNARRHGVGLRARRGSLFEALGGERFHVIVSNPPYVPSRTDHLPRRGAERAWDAGAAGRSVLDRICAEAPGHLVPGGVLLLVQSSLVGVEETVRALEAGGLRAEIAARRPGPLGPLMAGRAPMLAERGLLGVGEGSEDLVVIRAASEIEHGRRHPGRSAIQAGWRGPTAIVASP
ncbi:MAG: methyltransferase [Actinomycetota bacterium]|nr:methyltransferase [Actinomycetota bacterium]